MEKENKLIVKNFIEKITNTGNVENIADYISPDYTEVFNGKRYPVGIEGAKEHIIGVRKTYSNLKLEIENQIAEGDWVVTCYTMTGVHTGEWAGIKPTDKKVTVTGVNVNKVIDGKIVEHGGAANILEAFMEIGVVKLVGKDS
ncbi:MAG: ester cyclase [Ignavibacteria bacterium]|jgi:predicted ester cyclase